MTILDNEKATKLQKLLESHAGKKLQLKINDNRSTMLSVKWEPDHTKVSLHWMFLGAPKNIMQALACYLRGDQKSLSPSIKAYIEENLQKLDYSSELNLKQLDTVGTYYNIKKIYDSLNREYFNQSLKLHITWFGSGRLPSSNRITFGLYYDPLKLIKISRFLDNPRVPAYFVEYVIYHEMLHFACPTYVDDRGIKQIHSKEFREREKQYRHFSKAQKWIQDNHNYLFSSVYIL